MSWIAIAIGAIGELRELFGLLTAKSKTTNVHKKMIIRELRDNLKRYESVFKNRLSINALIDDISNEAIEKAINDNFNFKKLKKGYIPESIIHEPRNRKYIGWTAEAIVEKIDEKTEELKCIKRLNGGTVASLAKTNINLMLSNQFYRMKLLGRFINE